MINRAVKKREEEKITALTTLPEGSIATLTMKLIVLTKTLKLVWHAKEQQLQDKK